MKNTINNPVFDMQNIDTKTLKQLGILTRTSALTSTKQKIIDLFKKAGEEGKQKGLTITQVTVAYYNEYTKPLVEKNKNSITVILHRMTQQGILELYSRGTYKMKDIFYKERPVFDRSTNKWIAESENIKNAFTEITHIKK